MVDTPAGAAVDARAELGAAAARSCAALADKREARAARAALLERQAAQLTRQLLRKREAEIEQRLSQDSVTSRANHERILQRLAEEAHGKETEGVVAREVSRQIFDQMQMRQRLREEKGGQRRAEEAERDKWKQARSLYEKMSLEGRLRERERANQERGDQVRAKQREHEERAKEVGRQESERKQTWQAHHTEQADRAEQRRQGETRELLEKTRDQRSAMAKRQGEVEQRRKQLEEERHAGFRQSSARWQERLEQQRAAARAADEERIASLLKKERSRSEGRDHSVGVSSEGEAAAQGADPWRGRGRKGVRTAVAESAALQPAARAAAGGDTPELPRPQEKPAPPPQATPYWSPDLAQAHARVKKQYVQRIIELDQATERAFSTKKFKALAGAAKDDQDPHAARLQALQNMYFSRTPRDKKEDAGTALSSTMVSTSSAPSRRVRPCGLCAREFLLEALPGSAPREAVARLRAEREGAASGALAGQAPPPHSATPRRRRDAAESTSSSPRGRPGTSPRAPQTARGPASRCYEEQVRLCEPCWNFARMRKM